MPRKHLMGDLKTRILPIFRRSSGSSAKSTTNSSIQSAVDLPKTRSKASLVSRAKANSLAEPVPEERSSPTATSSPSPNLPELSYSDDQEPFERPPTPPRSPLSHVQVEKVDNPRVTVEEATPDHGIELSPPVGPKSNTREDGTGTLLKGFRLGHKHVLKDFPKSSTGPSSSAATGDYFGVAPVLSPSMLHRKIWVKRPGASATLIQIDEEDLVDDARDKILRKYANSLGRTFDSPDVTMRIIPRDGVQLKHGSVERSLGPEESICRTLDNYFPGGQSVEEALLIDVPHRRTPRHSPRVYADNRPPENGADYFPVMPVAVNHSPHLPSNVSIAGSAGSGQQIHAISVLSTGHVPPLPSPGASGRAARHGSHRPKFGRTSTSSPTVLSASIPHPDPRQIVPNTPSAPALPTPPLATAGMPQTNASTPPARVGSPRPSKALKNKKSKKPTINQTPLPTSLLDGGVPPINVLIVEDNVINLRLLEAFMKRLKVRWHTAMNGRDAVKKWRSGGFHLVLMDIQLPIMNGLDATKEIRKLERVNGIGVFADKFDDEEDKTSDRPEDDTKADGSDRLENRDSFKSPVIIVALTASSLQSDRHEALAAGCNDFLTKPVKLPWLERKVMEWGCMQALIDFEGWRKWKEFAQDSSVPMKKSLDISSTPKSTAATFNNNAALPSKTREAASNSASTGSSGSTSSPNPPLHDTLMALNEKTESADTLESVSTFHSTSSAETAAPFASSTATLTPQATLQRQIPPQPTKQLSQPQVHALRSLASDTAQATAKQAPLPKSNGSVKDDRRRKRSSLGHGGLTGVVEELEDGDMSSAGHVSGRQNTRS